MLPGSFSREPVLEQHDARFQNLAIPQLSRALPSELRYYGLDDHCYQSLLSVSRTIEFLNSERGCTRAHLRTVPRLQIDGVRQQATQFVHRLLRLLDIHGCSMTPSTLVGIERAPCSLPLPGIANNLNNGLPSWQ